MLISVYVSMFIPAFNGYDVISEVTWKITSLKTVLPITDDPLLNLTVHVSLMNYDRKPNRRIIILMIFRIKFCS